MVVLSGMKEFDGDTLSHFDTSPVCQRQMNRMAVPYTALACTASHKMYFW